VSLSLTRAVTFRATHRLALPRWSEAENRARFGWTAEPPGHEHQYTCAVTVAGSPDPDTGALVDLATLDAILEEEVLGPLDGRHLNDVVPPFLEGRVLATCEALARWLYHRIAARLPGGLRLERVRVAEDPTLYADCTGPL
jgi:6-pyruvoyltetrahydropterin/6-carboxytetrahydropterin synthase